MNLIKTLLKYLLAVFFIGSGVNHFLNPDFYVAIMPLYMPSPKSLVLLSGATEIIAGVMVATPRLSRYGAWFVIAHLLIFFTVHIDMIQHADRYPDIPLVGLWIRIPFQCLFIFWGYWFTKEETTQPSQGDEG